GVAPRPDDQQVAGGAGGGELGRRPALADAQLGPAAGQVVDGPAQRVGGLLVAGLRREPLGQDRPGPQLGGVQAGLAGCPGERPGRAGRAVESDDDAFHGRVLLQAGVRLIVSRGSSGYLPPWAEVQSGPWARDERTL